MLPQSHYSFQQNGHNRSLDGTEELDQWLPLFPYEPGEHPT